ncbi:MAG: RNA polymerase sigma factor [Bradyrhizobium sp.]|nr:RNA polymerase sigma factor [Bradyrhizobium sp.]
MSREPGDPSDNALVALSLAGQDRAFAEIVCRHREALYRIAVASLGNADDALDAVQDSFVAAHTALRRFDGTRPLRPWLAAIALNRCRDLARRRRVRRFLAFALPMDGTVESVALDMPSAETAAADREELDRTVEAIANLPAALREPLILHALTGLSQAETAQTLKISEKAVETRLRRARQELRSILGLLK